MSIGQTDSILTDHPNDSDSVVFYLSALAGVPATVDIIPDFGNGDGDVIDLAGLLDGVLVPFSEVADGHDLNSGIDSPEAVISDTLLSPDTVVFSYWSADAGLKILYDEDLTSQTNHT